MNSVADITDIVKNLLDSYDNDGGVNHTDGSNLPSQSHIINIMQTLRGLVFPGYFDKAAVDEAALRYTTGERVVWVDKHLSEEIFRCLCYECNRRSECTDLAPCQDQAREITRDFLRALPGIRRQLQQDVQAALGGDPAAADRDEVIMAYPSIAAITVHRLVHFLYLHKVPLLPRIMSEYIHHRSGIDIHPGAQIGKSFFIDHGTGVVIGETTIIGDRVKIYQGVTIGALSVERNLRGTRRHPTIEDDVTIYAGATILGGETVIGQGSVIGGNVWIVKSIPAYSKVVSNPETRQRQVSLNEVDK